MIENRRLLLVTNDYPYPSGEQFLELEIDVLRRHYSSIHVLPVNHAHRHISLKPRPVPPEVRVVTFGSISARRALWSCAPRSSWILTQTLKATWHAGIRRPVPWVSTLATVIRRCDVAQRIVQSELLASSHAVYAYWANTTAYLLAQLRAIAGPELHRQPFVARAHGYDLWAERSGLAHLPFQGAVLKACDLICPCSNMGAHYLRERYPAHAHKIRRVYLGVAPQPWIAASSSDGVLRLLTCSQIVPVKRLHLLANAIALLRRPVQWTHIGDGPDGPALQQRCAQLPARIKIDFLGHIPNAAILAFYRQHPVDLFANISSSEGVPVSIMEAMSFGVPILATSVGGVAELVRPEAGQLVPADFLPDQLAAWIEDFNPANYDRHRIQTWQQRAFSTANYEDFATQVLCSPRGQGAQED
jgi:glycosyltransferase involved in cell wall biosynthesis